MSKRPGDDDTEPIDGIIEKAFRLQGRHQHAEAIAMFRRALETPEHARALGGLAFSYRATGNIGEALESYQKLLEHNPQWAEVYYEVGTLMLALGNATGAIDFFRKTVRLKPEFLSTYPYLAYAMQNLCDWENIEAVVERAIDCALAAAEHGVLVIPPFALLTLPLDAETRSAVARHTAAQASARREGPAFSHPPAGAGGLKRIGYLSPDFRRHSVGLAFYEVLKAHDRSRFEIFGYSTATGPGDDYTAKYQQSFDHWRDLAGHAHRDAAAQIFEDKIDILVDLAGHTSGGRLEILAYRPAPLQAHFLGYGFTTGAEYVDYLISDAVTTPAAAQAFCSEKIIYLPHHSLPGTSSSFQQPDSSAGPTRAAAGLPEAGFIFAGFNAHHKIEPGVFGAWMRILRALPQAFLWLIGGEAKAEENLRAQARSRGVDAGRLLFAAKIDYADHIERLRLADLALDTFVHAGGVTTTDALGAGLPVVTLLSDKYHDHTGASLLYAAGLAELVAATEDGYVDLAVGLASDAGRLDEVRQKLLRARSGGDRAARAPLFDSAALASQLEFGYDSAWELYAAGRAPANIDVPSIAGDPS